MPKPSHVVQAPNGELKENPRGCNSSKEISFERLEAKTSVLIEKLITSLLLSSKKHQKKLLS